MSTTKQTKGKCVFCKREMTAGGLIRHLQACDQRQAAFDKVQMGREQDLYHLYIKNAYNSDFWLHLEMNGTAPLRELDQYLRRIWLECCGHLSHFTYGRDPWGTEISMSRTLDQIMEPDLELTHVYDFGTSTQTLIKVSDVRRGRPLHEHPIYLMARNNLPEITCEECGKKAKWLYENYDKPYGYIALCEGHLRNYSEDAEYGAIEIVNSPRVGVCGYVGPAEPPY
ncbi:MAG TPA: hypothetical protein VE870_04595 [Bacteroidales bacterium]|nr:hypothetical protein [Bacteroidales bacterium]